MKLTLEMKGAYLSELQQTQDHWLAMEAALALVPIPLPRSHFQARVNGWMHACFGPAVAADLKERPHRFLEEGLELVQSAGTTKAEALQLVDYVFGRRAGEPRQEVGGTMVTLAALCTAIGVNMASAAETELSRVSTPEMIAKLQAKNAAKDPNSPLPGFANLPHDLYETGDADAPDAIKDRNGEVVLGLCRRCNKGEIELDEPCEPPPQNGGALPQDIVDSLLAIGPVEWGRTLSQTDEMHIADFTSTLRLTREHFGVTQDKTTIHGVYPAGENVVLAHMGTSPNSPQHARILVGAWNELVERARAQEAAR